MKPSFIFMVILALSYNIHAQDRQAISLYFDNDLLYIPQNDDRDYTFGMGVSMTSGKSGILPAGHLLTLTDRLFGLEHWHNSHHQSSYSHHISIKLFTPDNLKARVPVFRDQPYASLFSHTVSHSSFDYSRNLKIETSLETGLLGLIWAKNIQAGAHSLTRKIRETTYPVEPMGWENQISAGGEPTLKYSFSIEKEFQSLSVQNLRGKKHLEVTGLLRGDAGYQTGMTGGLQIRTGWMNQRGRNRKLGNECFFHAGYQIQIRGYNALLQGQFRPSVHRLTYQELHFMVRQWEAGITWNRRKYQAGVTLYSRSAEIKKTNHPVHIWGSLRTSIIL